MVVPWSIDLSRGGARWGAASGSTKPRPHCVPASQVLFAGANSSSKSSSFSSSHGAHTPPDMYQAVSETTASQVGARPSQTQHMAESQEGEYCVSATVSLLARVGGGWTKMCTFGGKSWGTQFAPPGPPKPPSNNAVHQCQQWNSVLLLMHDAFLRCPARDMPREERWKITPDRGTGIPVASGTN